MSKPIQRLAAGSAVMALTCGVVLSAPSAAIAESTDVKLITVDPKDSKRLESYDVVSTSNSGIQVLGTDQTIKDLKAEGIRVLKSDSYAKTIDPSGTSDLRSPKTESGAADNYPVPKKLQGENYDTYFGGYRTVDAYQKFAGDLSREYSDLVETVDFGDSWLKTEGKDGNDLIAIRITADVAKQPAPDDAQEGKPRFFLSGQIHSREIMTSELAWRYATELVDGYGVDPQTTSLLDSTEVWVAFQKNPDGVEVVQEAMNDVEVNEAGDGVPDYSSKAWQRKNLNDAGFTDQGLPWGAAQPGVDLNRNWPFQFGGAGTSPNPPDLQYRGPKGLSEPETDSFANLLEKLYGKYRTENDQKAPDDRKGLYLDLHSYSDFVLFPYTYDPTAAVPNLDAITGNAFRQSFGNDMVTGKPGDILYPVGGSDIDWVYSQLGVPSYTYELGTDESGGFFPSYERADDFWKRISPGIRFAAESAYEPYTTSLGGVVTELSAERGKDGSVSINGKATDNAYGNAEESKEWRPKETKIVAVETAVAKDRNSIGDTVQTTLDSEGTTVGFQAEVDADADNASAKYVFARAKNESGKWGPWQATSVSAIDAPVYTGEKTFDLTTGDKASIELTVDSAVNPTFTITDGSLPNGLTLDEKTGLIEGTPTKAGKTTATVRIDNGAGTAEVMLTFTVKDPDNSTAEADVDDDGNDSDGGSKTSDAGGSTTASAGDSVDNDGKSNGSELPRTGSQITPIIVWAAILTATGLAAVFIARRRKL